MEKTAAGPVKSRSSKGEAVRKAMTRRGLGIVALSMAENVSDRLILPPCASRAHLDGLGSGDRARSVRFVELWRYQRKGRGLSYIPESVRKVMEYRNASSGGMLCSQSVRASPERT